MSESFSIIKHNYSDAVDVVLHSCTTSEIMSAQALGMQLLFKVWWWKPSVKRSSSCIIATPAFFHGSSCHISDMRSVVRDGRRLQQEQPVVDIAKDNKTYRLDIL